MRENPKLEPIRQSVVVYNLVLTTSATALVPNCNIIAVPLDQSVTRRGGRATWATAGRPYIIAQAYIRTCITHVHNTLQTGEDTPASHCSVDTTRGATVTGYKPSRDWRKPRHPGLVPTVGGLRISLDSYRPPHAGQFPDRKVQSASRHGLLSSLGAWGLGTNRKAARN